jgi:hypothetical protein
MSLFDDAWATKKESSCSLSARKVAWLLQDEPRHPHVTFPIDRFLLRQQRRQRFRCNICRLDEFCPRRNSGDAPGIISIGVSPPGLAVSQAGDYTTLNFNHFRHRTGFHQRNS